MDDFWISVDEFLDKGIGFCVLKGNKIISNCFTGYVSGNIHEMVIRTYGEENKGKGFALLPLAHLCIIVFQMVLCHIGELMRIIFAPS